MKVWEKIYLIIMLLFLVVLNICNFLVFHSGYDKSLKSIQDSCISQWKNISISLAEDLAEVGENREGEWELFQLYVSGYSTEELSFELWKGTELRAKSRPGTQITYSAAEGRLESDFLLTEQDKEDILKKKSGQVVIRKKGNDKFSCTSGNLTGTSYQFIIYGKVTDVLDLWKTQMLFFVILEVAASVVMAFLLFCIIRRFLRPVSGISEAAARIAAGDYQYRLVVQGNDELARLAGDMNTMADQVRENMENKEKEAEIRQEFIDALSHELRTPVTSIHGYAQLMKNTQLSEEKKLLYLDYIVQESGRVISMTEILRQVILLRQQGMEQEIVSLKKLESSLRRMMEIQFQDKTLELELTVEEGEIRGNQTLTEIFFTNLIRNSYHACDGKGHIRVEITGQGAVVEDNGVGMTEECVEHIFEPFYREDKSRSRKMGGTGLGMYLCRQIADLHGWEIHIWSEKWKGTKITVSFSE